MKKTTRKTMTLPILSVFGVILLSCYLFMIFVFPVYMIGLCPFNICAPKRSFTVWDITFPQELFPAGKVNKDYQIHTTSSPSTFEQGWVGVGWDGYSQVFIDFLRSPTEKRAEYWFDRYLSLEIEERTKNDQLHVLEIADQYDSGCGKPRNIEMMDSACTMTARVEEYVIAVTVNGSDEESIALFNRLVDYINQDIGKRLGIIE
ncbi:MAG: hypothetical protein HYZ22_07985 [Chloroflexi bacterium]|nr:hypothetical protein [Chloroflexota bacterium]